jgi:hypothetical protein
MEPRSSRCNRNNTSKDTLYGLGPHKFGVAGTLYMTARDEYLLRAAELSAMAQAERNSQADIVSETPLKRIAIKPKNKPQERLAGRFTIDNRGSPRSEQCERHLHFCS